MKVLARRSTGTILAASLLAMASTLTACSGASGSSPTGSPASGQAGTKLILLELSFPCGLVEAIQIMCDSVTEAAKKLPPGYKLEIKTGVNYADVAAFNSQLQTSLELNPAGMIVFPNGPVAQTPILNKACDRGVKIVILDSPATGVKCQSSLVGADHTQLGADVGKWLVAHPPASKEVGIVTQPPGEYQSTDDRVKGFVQTVEAAGFQVVATAITNLALDTTRTEVTNMLTAHPNLGAIYSANGPMGQGTAQALKNNRNVLQLTLDFDPADVQPLLQGSLAAVGAQDAYVEGQLAVQTLAKAVAGEKVDPFVGIPLTVVDKTNAEAYVASSKTS